MGASRYISSTSSSVKRSPIVVSSSRRRSSWSTPYRNEARVRPVEQLNSAYHCFSSQKAGCIKKLLGQEIFLVAEQMVSCLQSKKLADPSSKLFHFPFMDNLRNFLSPKLDCSLIQIWNLWADNLAWEDPRRILLKKLILLSPSLRLSQESSR